MTPVERAFWQRLHRRGRTLTPEMRADLLRAFRLIGNSLNEREVSRLLHARDIENAIRTAFADKLLDPPFLSVRDRIRTDVSEGARRATVVVPGLTEAERTLAATFNVLNPRVITAVRTLESRVLDSLKSDIRETARAFIENALRDGTAPGTVARQLRDVVGLAPNQEEAIRNFRRLLESNDREALTRALRDRRFDPTVKRAMASGEGLSVKQVDSMVNAYSQRMIAFNAETQARTATLDSLKLGQRLSWGDAVDKGIVDPDRLMKRWVGVKDSRERQEHLDMEGEVVPYDAPFSNGELVPGESTYNCRCVALYFQARATAGSGSV